MYMHIAFAYVYVGMNKVPADHLQWITEWIGQEVTHYLSLGARLNNSMVLKQPYLREIIQATCCVGYIFICLLRIT